MSDFLSHLGRLTAAELSSIDEICWQFEQGHSSGHLLSIESLLSKAVGRVRERLLYELLRLDIAYRSGESPKRLELDYLRRFTDYARVVLDACRDSASDGASDPSGGDPAQHSTVTNVGEESIVLTPPEGVPRDLRYLEDYEVLTEIARGGMGIVYLARHRHTGDLAAVKILLGQSESREDQRWRFIREAETVRRLDHPGIVPVFGQGFLKGRPYFFMEYVPGADLDAVRRRETVDERQAAEWVFQAAVAIGQAHEQGVLHRDVKPSNLILGEDGRVRVTDFGLARKLDPAETLTKDGHILGTPHYMPPEQALGAHDVVGVRSDVYSLGAVFYFLLTGRPPFESDSVVHVLGRVVTSRPESPRSIDPSISTAAEAICLKCLAKKPEERYSSAKSLARSLPRLLDAPANVTPAAEGSDTWARFAIVSAGGVLLLAALLILFSMFWSNGETQTDGEAVTVAATDQVSGESTEPTTTLEVESATVDSSQQVPGNPDVPVPLGDGKVAADLPPSEPAFGRPPVVAPEPMIDGAAGNDDVAIAAAPAEVDDDPKDEAEPQKITPPISVPAWLFPRGRRPLGNDVDPPAWGQLPREARAVVFIKNMQQFSDDVDEIGVELGSGRLRKLDQAQKGARISEGLQRNGTIMWTWGPVADDRSPQTYLLPTADYERMIAGMSPKTLPDHQEVEYVGSQGELKPLKTLPGKQYGYFCRPGDLTWMKACARGEGGFDLVLGDALNAYLERLDIGYGVTTEGLNEGIELRYPLAGTDGVVPAPMVRAAGQTLNECGVSASAGGVRLAPEWGALASVAGVLDPGSELKEWGTPFFLSRDSLLSKLPAGKPALLIALSSNTRWNAYITQELRAGGMTKQRPGGSCVWPTPVGSAASL